MVKINHLQNGRSIDDKTAGIKKSITFDGNKITGLNSFRRNSKSVDTYWFAFV